MQVGHPVAGERYAAIMLADDAICDETIERSARNVEYVLERYGGVGRWVVSYIVVDDPVLLNVRQEPFGGLQIIGYARGVDATC